MSTFDDETKCGCTACKTRRREPTTNRYGQVHRWNYTPRRWTVKRLTGDTFPYAMGVELETSAHGDALWQEAVVGLRRPKTLWFCKYDASVSGPEFVSHPATLTYWKSKAPQLQEMFSLLVHAGYRSHDGGEAGMHVNIDKSAFTDARHLHRFLTFLYANPDWTLEVSQRHSGHMNQWAAMRHYTLGHAERMLSTSGYSPTSKYSIVNAPDYQKRLEFRLPRGTLRLDRFYKNLEWTAALIAYTRPVTDPYRLALRAPSFMQWLRDYGTTYENLINFTNERGQQLTSAMERDYLSHAPRLLDCEYDQAAQLVYGPPRPSDSELETNAWRNRTHIPYVSDYTITNNTTTQF